MLKINTLNIEREADFNLTDDFSVLNIEKDFINGQEVKVNVTVHKNIDGFWVNGNAEVEAQAVCSRCLCEFTQVIQAELNLIFTNTNEEVLIDDNVYTYTDDEINLLPAVREEIVLHKPLKTLCSENCKGICPACGKNLNKETCSCSGGEPEQFKNELPEWKKKLLKISGN